MEIKYNRFALLPHTCAECEKSFWLEPYKYYKISEERMMGIVDYKTHICKECSDKINALRGAEDGKID